MTVATAELIPVHTNPDGGNVVMGRDLHEFLEVRRDYTSWFKQMTDYGFSAGQDFLNNSVQNSNRGRPKQDHIITLDMAKEISMIQRTERGKQARQYFIECERRMKQLQPELTPGCFKGFAFQTRPLLKARFEHKAKTDYCSGVLLQRLEASTLHPKQAWSMHRTPEPFQTAPGFRT
ncbi:antA/AntB antirepressor family protein [Corynebacterium pseudodiphtheriticum]|uniref:antA/AntB antirepressor family protein n=1 Tax=Corynebacterium pseudodiphtheriticum TaxID=37637 RepID=UPI00254FF28B|nr:antA/AntB antirepressor family protein [Corynebacterium pseudodiphtheriticum]MDK8716995.1 antA/AntB antirepressor family protein [Corynebacterium pseudodiphtheriticum]